MKNRTDRATAYDDLPYPSFTFPQTNPDRLSTLAILHGLTPVPPSKCRYLELGCGDGTNIAYSASIFRDSEFFGIDLSTRHIDRARETSSVLELNNTQFEAVDILDLNANELGEFDYVVAHGLFSWVPDSVRDRILELMRDCLTDNGIGYISYNTYPGCYVRKIGWDLFGQMPKDVDDPMKDVASAKSVLSIIGSAAAEGSFQRSLYDEIESDLTGKNISNIFHDDLADLNHPYYFLEFARLIDNHGLRYVCEADPASVEEISDPELAKELASLTDDPLQREQYRDFIDLTKFRMSVFCKNTNPPTNAVLPEAIRRTYAITPLRSVSDTSTLVDTQSARFASTDGRSIKVNHPLTKSVLASLEQVVPTCLSELVPDSGTEAATTLEFLLKLYKARLLSLFTVPLSTHWIVEERPRVHKFARWQAANGCDCMTSLLGVNIGFSSELVRAMVSLLDGTRDSRSVVNDLVERLGIEEKDRAEARGKLPAIVDSNLQSFAELGLFTEQE